MEGKSTDPTTPWTTPVEAPLPDRGYFLKVLRRNWLFGATIAVIILVAGGLLAFQTKDVYRSSVVAIFDKRDALDVNLNGDMGPAAPETVEYAFQNRMVSADFLSELEKRVVLNTENGLARWERNAHLLPPETDEQHRSRMVSWFEKRLIAITSAGTGLLQLNVLLDDSPEKSVELASAAMEMFIESELQSAAARLDVKIEFLRDALLQARSRLKELQAAESTNNTKKTVRLTQADLMGPKQREAELLDKLRTSETEASNVTTEQSKRRAALETELQQLQSRLAPDHPDITAKKREISNFIAQSAKSTDLANREIPELRRELWQVRSSMVIPSAEAETATPMSSDERLEVLHVSALSQKVDELTLEKASLDRQVTDDRLRTRLKVIKPASYDMKPYARKRLQIVLGSIALTLIAVFLLMSVREATNPLARDGWRVMRLFNRKILAQLSQQSLLAFPSINPKQANDLRAKLSSNRSEDAAPGRTLLSYRRLELAIGRVRQGSMVFFAASGASDNTRTFFTSFANILTTDTASRVLVIDCALNDPLIKRKDGMDWIDAAMGKCDWRTLVVKADQTTTAFDLLPVNKPLTAERLGPLVRKGALPLLNELTTAYDIVLIRSFPETHFVENAALGALSTDTIVCVDAQNTTYFELGRTLAHLDGPSLRGLVLIGT